MPTRESNIHRPKKITLVRRERRTINDKKERDPCACSSVLPIPAKESAMKMTFSNPSGCKGDRNNRHNCTFQKV
jgi:hypothetical protein